MNSSENIEKLRKVLKSNLSTAVFVGAGASKLLGIRTWTEILVEMAKVFKSRKYNKKSIMKYLSDNEGKGHSQIASEIFSENPNDKLYKQFMKNQFTPQKTQSIDLHSKIANLFNIILTTNYDTTFEVKFKDLNFYLSKCHHPMKKIEVYKLPIFNHSKILLNDVTIVYLHGNNEEQNYIFLNKEYKTYYHNNYTKEELKEIDKTDTRLEDFLKMMIKEFNILFIGFSFVDENFIELFRRTYIKYFKDSPDAYRDLNGKVLNVTKPEYFAIVSDNIKDSNEWDFLHEFNINCITFSDDKYIEIEQILNELQTNIYVAPKPSEIEGAYAN